MDSSPPSRSSPSVVAGDKVPSCLAAANSSSTDDLVELSLTSLAPSTHIVPAGSSSSPNPPLPPPPAPSFPASSSSWSSSRSLSSSSVSTVAATPVNRGSLVQQNGTFQNQGSNPVDQKPSSGRSANPVALSAGAASEVTPLLKRPDGRRLSAINHSAVSSSNPSALESGSGQHLSGRVIQHREVTIPAAHLARQDRPPAVPVFHLSQGMQSKLVNALKLAFCLLPLFLLWNVHPADGLSRSSMHILAVFLSVILSLLLSDLKISVIVMVALLVLAFTQSFQCTTVDGIKVDCRRCQREIRPVPHLSFDGYNYTVTTEMPVSVYDVYQCDGMKQSFSIALSGFALPLSWLVLCSFQIGKAVERTGLGRRLSLILVRHLGGSILGLGYSLFASELILGPFLPSNTARGAGIIMPVVVSLARVLGSTPTASPTIGRFLILCGSHANLLISSIYMTATVANPLVSEHAADILGIKFDFPTWVLGSVVPGVFLILVLPPILAYICGAAEYDGTAVRHSAKTELESLGKLTWRECQLIMVVWVCLILWIMNILPEAFVAMTGLAMLLCMGTIQWEDVASNSQAWDAFFWLSGMVLIAEQLTALGLTRWFGRWCGDHFRDGHNPVRASIGLSSFYFFSMYFFSSLTGHIVAFVGPLMEAGKSLEVPPFLLTALLAYFSSLSGCLTNYSSGPPVVYFSQGYFKQSQWFLIGLGLACLYWLVYLTLGLAWWKWLGWF